MTIQGPTPGNLISKIDEVIAAVNAGSGAPGLPTATPLTTEIVANPITGIGTMTVAVFPATTVVFAVKIEGDAFPRFVMGSTQDGWYFGDGTIDPTGGPNLNWGNDQIGIFGGDLEVAQNSRGVILHSPNNTRHRLTVANDGTVSSSPA